MSTEGQTPKKNAARTYPLVTVVAIAALSALLGAFIGSSISRPAPGPPTLAVSPPPVNEVSLELGETSETLLGNRITAFSVKATDRRPLGLQERFTLWRSDVEWCAGSSQSPVEVDNLVSLFSLSMPDGRRVAAEIFDVGRETLAVNSGAVGGGQCVRGLVSFAVPDGERPSELNFSGATLVRWRVT